jgi:hypothetical protein
MRPPRAPQPRTAFFSQERWAVLFFSAHAYSQSQEHLKAYVSSNLAGAFSRLLRHQRKRFRLHVVALAELCGPKLTKFEVDFFHIENINVFREKKISAPMHRKGSEAQIMKSIIPLRRLTKFTRNYVSMSRDKRGGIVTIVIISKFHKLYRRL